MNLFFGYTVKVRLLRIKYVASIPVNMKNNERENHYVYFAPYLFLKVTRFWALIFYFLTSSRTMIVTYFSLSFEILTALLARSEDII